MQDPIEQFVEILTGCKLIPLTNGNVTAVDPEDFEWLSKWAWGREIGGYVRRQIKVKGKVFCVLMHRVIMDAPKHLQVDHRDMVRNNNQRFNLRLATMSDNRCNQKIDKRNRSGFKGIYYAPHCKMWRASIAKNRKVTHLGYYKTPEEAHAAYAKAAKEIHGEFHRLK